jgi:hypothetical protein
MPHHLHPARIALNQIDFEDDSYCLTPWPSSPLPEALAQSIARTGILHPPLLKAKAMNSFQIIAGRKRLQGVRQVLNASRCLCLILPLEIPAPEALILGMEEILSSRPLTLVERSVVLQKARGLLGEQQMNSFFPLLGLSPHTVYDEQLKLLTLEEPILRALHAGHLDEQVAWKFTNLSFIDRMALFETFEYLVLDFHSQQKLAASFGALAKRRNGTIFELLAAPPVRKILDRPGVDPGQKTSDLLATLHQDLADS